MDNSIEDILGSTPTEEATEIVETQPEVETPERERDEHGRFKAKETGEEPDDGKITDIPGVTPTPEPEPQSIPIAALKDERQKRQQAEDLVRQYEEHFARLNAQPQEEVDMFADPEGFKAQLAQQIRADLVREMQPQLQHQSVMNRAEVSEMLARQKYEDYDAKIEVFKEAIQSNPFLLTQIQQAPDPATYAYNAANQYIEAKQYGAATPSRATIEAEIREQIKAELGLNRPTVPTTLAGDRSVASRSGPSWAGPTALGDILKP